MPKNKKITKKDEIVEIKSTRSSKFISTSEVIKKVVDTDNVVEIKDSDDNRNPDLNDNGLVTEGLDSVSDDSGTTSDEEVIQIYRDVMVMSDEDRNSDFDGKLAPLRLSPPPQPSWSDDIKNLKFKVGDFVRYKINSTGNSYKVCGASIKKNHYMIQGSKCRDSFDENGDKIQKVSEKDANWIDYWSQYPVIPAPKPWLKKPEKTVEKQKNIKKVNLWK